MARVMRGSFLAGMALLALLDAHDACAQTLKTGRLTPAQLGQISPSSIGAVPQSGLTDPRTGNVVPAAMVDKQRLVSVLQYKFAADYDDTQSFQRAINLANTLHAKIYVPGGDYYIGGNCQRVDIPVVNTAEQIYGDGMGQSIVHMDTTSCTNSASTKDPEIFRLYNGASIGPHSNYFTMRDISLLGNFMEGKAASGSSAAVGAFAASNRIAFALFGLTAAAFDHVELGDLPYFGDSSTMTNLIWASNSWFHHIARDAISAQDTTAIYSSFNRFEHTDDDALSPHANNGSETYTGHVRRYIQSVGDVMTDVGGCVDAIGALHMQIVNLTCDRPHNYGITTSFNSGSDIGPSYISVVNSHILNVMNSGYVAGSTQQYASAGIRLDSYVSTGGSGGTTLNTPPMTNDPTASNAAIVSQYAYTYLSAGQNAAMPKPNAGAFGVHITGNDIGRTVPLGGTYSSLGFDQYFSRNGWLNPTLTAQNIGQTTAVMLTGNFYDLDVSDNMIRGVYDCLSLGQALSASTGNSVGTTPMVMMGAVHDNQCSDYSKAGVDLTAGLLAVTPTFHDNLWNGDPLRSHANRLATGSAAWLQTAASGQTVSPVVVAKNGGTVPKIVMSDTIRNVMAITDSGAVPASGDFDGHMTIEAAPVLAGGYSTGNLGVGLAPLAGDLWHYRVLDLGVTSSTYGQILNVEPSEAAAMPATGSWVAGTIVRNTAWSPVNVATAWLRMTTGSGNVLGVDWSPVSNIGLQGGNGAITPVIASGAMGYWWSGKGGANVLTPTFTAPGNGGLTATGHAALVTVLGFDATPSGAGAGCAAGTFNLNDTAGRLVGTMTINTVDGSGKVTSSSTAATTSALALVGGALPTGTGANGSFSPAGTACTTLPTIDYADFQLTTAGVAMDTEGSLYLAAPTFSVANSLNQGFAATGTTTLQPEAVINGDTVLGGKIWLNKAQGLWGQVSGTKFIIGSGVTNAFSIDTSTGNLVVRGNVTAAGAP